VKDELHEGDQVLVKVLGIEGNRIKLSRKALLKEQRAKLGLTEPAPIGDVAASAEHEEGQEHPQRPARQDERQPSSNASTITIEGGEDFDDDAEGGDEGGEEVNFNRADGAPATAGSGERRPGGGGGPRRRRGRGRGRGPGGPGGGRGPGGGSRGPQ
jgi:polyribonucleotide nucleotidyltransferase